MLMLLVHGHTSTSTILALWCYLTQKHVYMATSLTFLFCLSGLSFPDLFFWEISTHLGGNQM